MYFIDFFKRLSKKGNIPIIIYLILNVFVIGFVVELALFGFFAGSEDTFGKSYPIYLGVGLVLYLISIAIALSPVGEWILRVQNGCHKIKRKEQIEYIEPIFREVYEKAKAKDPSISDNVSIWINDSESANAFATGRKTICITKGMLRVSPNELKAVLAHEFGHIAHKDTDLILVITVGNLIVSLIVFLLRIIVFILGFFFDLVSNDDRNLFTGMITSFLVNTIIGGIMWVWTQFGRLLVLASSRAQEYAADAFAYNVGYGDNLCSFLDRFTDGTAAKGVFAVLERSHPRNDDRIAKLQEMGSSYRSTY